MRRKSNGQGQKGKFTGVYTHYRRQPDGSLKLVGEVAYRHDADPSPDFDAVLRENLGYDVRPSLREAEATLAEARETAEAFESLIDLANETEGLGIRD